jgi:SAM-dependent methyltransferase
MPHDWDAHYAGAADLDLDPQPLLIEVAELLPPGRALDLACGPGRNALYLARLGWRVTAVDSSAVAIRMLRQRAAGLPVEAHVADLASGGFPIPPSSYDLVCDFFYLQRDLFPRIREGVRLGGTFAGAIHLRDETRPSSFALDPGELRREFAGWKIFFYSEGAESGRSRPSARIIARRA